MRINVRLARGFFLILFSILCLSLFSCGGTASTGITADTLDVKITGCDAGAFPAWFHSLTENGAPKQEILFILADASGGPAAVQYDESCYRLYFKDKEITPVKEKREPDYNRSTDQPLPLSGRVPRPDGRCPGFPGGDVRLQRARHGGIPAVDARQPDARRH